MKKTIILILVIANVYVANSQQLTLNETVRYINNILEPKDLLSISEDGMIEFLQIRGDSAMYKAHLSDIELNKDLFSYNNNYNFWINIHCKQGGCIVEGKKRFESFLPGSPIIALGYQNRNVSFFSMRTVDGDRYSTQKLWNAVNYLFSLAKQNGMDKRVDDDPFAPSNYNPSAFTIKSSKDKGSIQLTRHGGVYFISVSIGNTSDNFVLDTGASDVSISAEMERRLIQNGIIKRENYLENGLYRIANGNIVECRRLIIPQLTIGDFTIENIQASVGIGQSPLLLGKSVLDRFRKWSINNLTQTLDVVK